MSDASKVTLGDIKTAQKILDMWLNNKVKRHNQDQWLEIMSIVPSIDDAEDVLKALAFYLGVKLK